LGVWYVLSLRKELENMRFFISGVNEIDNKIELSKPLNEE